MSEEIKDRMDIFGESLKDIDLNGKKISNDDIFRGKRNR